MQYTTHSLRITTITLSPHINFNVFAPTYLAGWFTPFVATWMIIAALSAVQTLTSDLVAAICTPTGENTRPSTSRRAVESTGVTYNKDGRWEHTSIARLTLF